MLGYACSLRLTSRLSHQMSMVHLIKRQIITVNLTKPYPFNMANLIKLHGYFHGHLSILTKSLI
jgi:hypothetical protein